MNEALLPGEKVLASRPANLMVGFDADAKLDGASSLAQLHKLAPSLVKGRSIGGKVDVTSYRLLFSSNRLNSIRGTVSIFHPTIVYDEPVISGFAGQWVVKTRTTIHRFAVRDPKELSQLLRHTREAPLDAAALKEHVKGNLEKVSQGITPFWDQKDLAKTLEAKKANSLQVVGLLGALELLTG
jgi:hypothetical protein